MEKPSLNSIIEHGMDRYTKLKDQSILFNGLTSLAEFSFVTVKFATSPIISLIKLPGKYSYLNILTYPKTLNINPGCKSELEHFSPGLNLILVPKQGGLRGNFSPSNKFLTKYILAPSTTKITEKHNLFIYNR